MSHLYGSNLVRSALKIFVCSSQLITLSFLLTVQGQLRKKHLVLNPSKRCHALEYFEQLAIVSVLQLV